MHAGQRIGFLGDPGELPAELSAFRPTILLAVPRVFEKVAAAAREQAEAEGHQRLFAAAKATAIACSRAGRRAGMLLRLRHAVFTIMEGWGLTETTGLVTMNPPAVQRIGPVGLPLPGCAVRIAPDGEVEVQGPVVFQGYWHDPQATSEVFDGRWLRTGDLGRLDDDDRRPYTAVSRAEGIKRFCVLPAGFAVGAEPTQTQNTRPDYVLAKFATDVEALYS